MNQILRHFWNDSSSSSSILSPAVDIYETDKAWTIHAELPGVRKEDIKIDLSGDMITISGESKSSQEYAKDQARYQERREGVFSRSLSLPDNVDRDKIQAKYENGVLTVEMPKTKDATKPARKITVQ